MVYIDRRWSTGVRFIPDSEADPTSKMERFVIIVNGWKPLSIIAKRSISDVTAALDPPLMRKVKIDLLSVLIKVSWRNSNFMT